MGYVFMLSACLATRFSLEPWSFNHPCVFMLIWLWIHPGVSQLFPSKTKSCHIWQNSCSIVYPKHTVWMCHAWLLPPGIVLYCYLNATCTFKYVNMPSCCAPKQHMVLVPSDQRHHSFIILGALSCKKTHEKKLLKNSIQMPLALC